MIVRQGVSMRLSTIRPARTIPMVVVAPTQVRLRIVEATDITPVQAMVVVAGDRIITTIAQVEMDARAILPPRLLPTTATQATTRIMPVHAKAVGVVIRLLPEQVIADVAAAAISSHSPATNSRLTKARAGVVISSLNQATSSQVTAHQAGVIALQATVPQVVVAEALPQVVADVVHGSFPK